MEKQELQYQPGMLIKCRKRLWRVDSQQGNVLTVTAVNENTKKTKIYLPAEEVKSGSLPLPTSQKIGTPQMQKLMLDAFRLNMVNSTTPLRSLQYSRAVPVPYQLVPVAMSLEEPRVRLLIADDVGLGKTIEAGLIIQELIARGRAKKLLVICPASLREQWKEALDYFFHIKANIYSRENRRRLERTLPAGTNLLEFQDAFIVSIDYAKSVDIKNLLLDVNWDIVVIDEAHQAAKPHQSSAEQSINKERWQLALEISRAKNIEHLLLLTATPHNGYTDSFASLIHLLDVDALEGPLHDPIIKADIARQHVIQRRRSDVQDWLTYGSSYRGFPSRDQDEKIIRPSYDELEMIKELHTYGNIILDNARTAQKRIRVLANWAVLHLHKRALSSPEALRCSLRNRKNALMERLNSMIEDDPGISEQDARADVLDEATSEQHAEEEGISSRAEKVTPGTREMLEEEFSRLDDLIEQAKRITPAKDSKLQELIKNVLRDMLRLKDKVIIFTKYVDTMNYVAQELKASARYEFVDIFTLDGSLNETQRYERFKEFGQANKAVLIATDAISEGINLQQYASQVIHYELPWNPNRLEQRNGRVDRFGQQAPEVKIRTLVLDETLDATILKVLVQKSNQIRQDYGFSPPYFGDETNVLDLISEHGMSVSEAGIQLSLLDELKSNHPLEENPFDTQVLERIRSDSFYGQSSYSLEYIHEQIQKTFSESSSPEAIRNFVFSGLNRYNCAVSENQDETWKISIQHPELKISGKEDVLKKVSFDPEKGIQSGEIEILDLGHPLILRLIDLIKKDTFDESDASYGRTAAFFSEDVSETNAVLHILVRYVTNSEPAEIFEDLTAISLPVYADSPNSEETTQRLLEAKAAKGSLTPEEISEVLEDLFERQDFESLILKKLYQRKETVLASRHAIRESLQRNIPWQKEETLSIGSWDLLSVQILWPA